MLSSSFLVQSHCQIKQESEIQGWQSVCLPMFNGLLIIALGTNVFFVNVDMQINQQESSEGDPNDQHDLCILA